VATRAFVLAGGEGRRLAPLTTIIPKPLVPVGHLSILEILVKQLVHAGVTDVCISIGYLGHLIEAVMGDGSRLGASITYTRESAPLGTAGALGLVPDVEDDDLYLVLNGDTLTDLSFDRLIDAHRSANAAATIACHRRQIRGEFGVLEIGRRQELVGYSEKPVIEQVVSMGVNIVEGRHINRQLKPSRFCNMPDLLVELSRTQLVHCYEHPGVWLDLGRVDDVRAANELFTECPDLFVPS
jgi:NDP-mannose synthase